MRLAGLLSNSFVDYPGHIAAVVFAAGCNMDCWYCHNRHILGPGGPQMEEQKVFDFLLSRKSFIDGAVFTGGEPLLQEDALPFLRKLRETGLLIKLDTNGSFPGALEKAIQEQLVDYIAMDIKAPYELYEKVTPAFDIAAVKRSAKLIMGGGVNYEFRTTFAPSLNAEDIGAIAKSIAGARKYCIQQYKKSEGMRAKIAPEPHGLQEIRKAETLARQHISHVIVRGAY
jgi:pyruvate formate lyase activating enzyme